MHPFLVQKIYSILSSLEENLLHWMGNVNMTAEVLFGYEEQDPCLPVLNLIISNLGYQPKKTNQMITIIHSIGTLCKMSRCSSDCDPPCLNGVCLSSRPESQVGHHCFKDFVPLLLLLLIDIIHIIPAMIITTLIITTIPTMIIVSATATTAGVEACARSPI